MRVLNACAEAESSLDPKKGGGKKYVGLFQRESDKGPGATCAMYIKPFEKFLSCNSIEDPETNTALAASRFHRHFKGQSVAADGKLTDDPSLIAITKACPNADIEALTALAYVGHNNGPGVLQFVLRRAKSSGACSLKHQEKAVRSFYSNPAIGNQDGNYEITKDGAPPQVCPNQDELKGKWSYHCVSEDYGAKKWKYGVDRVASVVKKAGITDLYPEGALNPALCPLTSNPPGRIPAGQLAQAP